MIRAFALSVLLSLPVQGGWAMGPEVSIRPTARPIGQISGTPIRLRVYFNSSFRPTARPSATAPTTLGRRQIFLVPVRYGNGGYRPAARPGGAITYASTAAMVRPVLAGPAVPRPTVRPYSARQPRLIQSGAVVTQPQGLSSGKVGRLCGKSSIRGQTLSRVSGRLNGCGIAKPVRVTEVAGVALSKPTVMDCDTAKSLDRWVAKGAKPTIGRLGGGLARVDVIAGYSCRTRNNQPGAQISEHGKGRAVDVSGFTMANGKTVTVLKGWQNRGERRLLEKLHKSACGTFGTVLGPKSDKFHKDHFHLDTARHRGGSYCR